MAAIDALGQPIRPVAASETDGLLSRRTQPQRPLTATKIELDLNPNPRLPGDGGKPEGKPRGQRSIQPVSEPPAARERQAQGHRNQRLLVALAQQPTPTACRQTKYEGAEALHGPRVPHNWRAYWRTGPPRTKNPAICRASSSTANGIRTRVTAVRGRRPSPLDDGGLMLGRFHRGYQRAAITRLLACAPPGGLRVRYLRPSLTRMWRNW
jgi:hypothetical protein